MIEDLMHKPFKKKSENYKKFRLCKDEDYQRLGVTNYVANV